MKHTFSVLFVIMVGLFLGACSGGNDAQSTVNPAPIGPMEAAATLSAQVSSVRGGQIQVQGATNLPKGTELSVNLGNEVIKSIAKITTTVSKGEFVAALPVPDGGLEVGDYQIKVVVSVAASQPESVQAVIGKQGEFLTGSLIKDVSWGGRIVEIVFPYTVGK